MESLSASEIGAFSSKTAENKNRPLHQTSAVVLSAFLNISYYVGFSPIKIKQLHDGTVAISGHPVQKGLCMLLIIATNVIRFAEVRKRLPKSEIEWNPLFYVKCLSGIINLIFNLSASYALFKKSEQIQKLSNFLNTSNILPKPVGRIQKAVWICCLLTIGEILLGTVLSLVDMKVISMDGLQLTFTEWVWCMKEEANLVLRSDFVLCNNGTSEVNQHEMFATDYGLAIVLCVSKLFRHIHGYIGEHFLLIGVVCLWLPASGFCTMIRRSYETPNVSFLSQFEILQEKQSSLKHLSKLINDVFGSMMFWFINASIMYFSCNLDALVITNNAFVKVRLSTFYVSAALTFQLAADIPHKVVSSFQDLSCLLSFKN
ncbi:unnamed protein product [Orchesella dallaii]|uniref:Gustatory receptor n=1 Tax=Orchesella dallaii TaxID=48710 RepID=A0ABP1RFG5_9HEXA